MSLGIYWFRKFELQEKVTEHLPMAPLFQFLTLLAFKIFISEKVSHESFNCNWGLDVFIVSIFSLARQLQSVLLNFFLSLFFSRILMYPSKLLSIIPLIIWKLNPQRVYFIRKIVNDLRSNEFPGISNGDAMVWIPLPST